MPAKFGGDQSPVLDHGFEVAEGSESYPGYHCGKQPGRNWVVLERRGVILDRNPHVSLNDIPPVIGACLVGILIYLHALDRFQALQGESFFFLVGHLSRFRGRRRCAFG